MIYEFIIGGSCQIDCIDKDTDNSESSIATLNDNSIPHCVSDTDIEIVSDRITEIVPDSITEIVSDSASNRINDPIPGKLNSNKTNKNDLTDTNGNKKSSKYLIFV